MAKILKLNAISPVADSIIPKTYEYSDAVKAPDGIIVRSAAMKEYDFDSDPQLLAIARAGAGVNNIPVDVCTQKGIVVFNTPGANANAVKELVLCELFLGGRKIIPAANWAQTLTGEGANLSKTVEKGKSKFIGREIYGKTLGVIGLGAIGKMVASSAFALGMKVIGYDPFVTSLEDRHINLVKTTKEIFANCDYITVHVPLTDSTKEMFNAKSLASCKDGVVIINNSRGELVNSSDMVAAVESGKVARYITDFGSTELLGKDNIIVLPHLGASTPEAEDNCAKMAAEQLVDFIENGNIKNSVNYPAVSMPRQTVSRVTVMHKNVKEILSKILAMVSGVGINISTMQDQSKGEYAYLILELDSAPATSVIENIKAINGVIRVFTF